MEAMACLVSTRASLAKRVQTALFLFERAEVQCMRGATIYRVCTYRCSCQQSRSCMTGACVSCLSRRAFANPVFLRLCLPLYLLLEPSSHDPFVSAAALISYHVHLR